LRILSVPKSINTHDRTGTLLLSPHPDDIGFSLGGALLLKYFDNPFLLTVFTRSSHAPSTSYHGKVDEVTALRIQEDRQYASSLMLEYVHLDFDDAIIRGYKNVKSLFQVQNPACDPVFPQVRNELHRIITSNNFESVITPMGIGNHVDHLIVRLATEHIMIDKSQTKNLIYFEDLPYAGNASRDEIQSIVHGVKHRLNPQLIDVSSVFEKKISVLSSCYKSQISQKDLKVLNKYAKKIAPHHNSYYERFWLEEKAY
jgi:2'-N-acetylparomamine deacetylase/2'''-acetyl-6'''-hydroxyneomycin deacetylase